MIAVVATHASIRNPDSLRSPQKRDSESAHALLSLPCLRSTQFHGRVVPQALDVTARSTDQLPLRITHQRCRSETKKRSSPLFARERSARDHPGCPRALEIEPASDSVDVQDFAGEM
jgi:hypothetical protein